MKNRILHIHPDDNVLVALDTLSSGEEIRIGSDLLVLVSDVPPKHKFAKEDIDAGGSVCMYGVLVGVATESIQQGERLTTENVSHTASPFTSRSGTFTWEAPDATAWENQTFDGYHRSDGRVGTANYWLVVPLVFCENRNIIALREAFDEPLGYALKSHYRSQVEELLAAYRSGKAPITQSVDLPEKPSRAKPKSRPFPNVDGIRYLIHQSGCGEQRSDSESLARLLAGYIAHPNVAGATVLGLGCQNTQVDLLQEALRRIAPEFDRPLYILEQQTSGSETALMTEAVQQTFEGLAIANQNRRKPAPLDKLILGLECGGSDGFSGISANPAMGHAVDLLVAVGGSAILSEFPELCGAEQDLINRCTNDALAERFMELQRAYDARVTAEGSGFDSNPSPGNIRDGLITDAMKSAGAAKKGGTSPVTGVLDYTEPLTEQGLNLLCTPGGDVESTTAMAGSGATIMAFSTGLGTPTGNPVAPVIKISTNTALASRMPDIIDFDAGAIISGDSSISDVGEALLALIVQVASGKKVPAAVRLRQDDFIPWKRGLSL